MKKDTYIISTTHVDSHGWQMAKSALESMLPQLNGPRKIRIGLDHIRTFPPFGIMTNGEIKEGDDGHYYLYADAIYFDKQEISEMLDGTKIIKESFTEGGFPFVECSLTEVEQIEISRDPSNYASLQEIEDLNKELGHSTDITFKAELFGRKSKIPDPETIITITTNVAIILGIIKTKIPEKLGEALGEDLAKFYKFISKLALDTIKKVVPKNRPVNFVVSYPNENCVIELVVTTTNHDKVLQALLIDKLAVINNKLEQLKNLNPEKIQFFFNPNNEWEFNYLLTKDGATIGALKAFNKRNLLYNQILQNQEKSENPHST